MQGGGWICYNFRQMLFSFLLLLPITFHDVIPTNPSPVRTTADLRALRDCDAPEQRLVDIVAQVISVNEKTIVVEDATGRGVLDYKFEEKNVSPGDVVHCKGISVMGNNLIPFDHLDEAAVIGKKELPEPLVAHIGDLDEQRDDLKQVVIEGTVASSLDDELDSRFRVLILKDGRATIPVYFSQEEHPDYHVETGSRVRVLGGYYRTIGARRNFQQPAVIGDRIDLLSPPPADPFDMPELPGRTWITIREIAELGRCKVTGEVLATWDGNRLMMKGRRNKLYFARLREGEPLPQPSAFVSLVGEADADFFNVTLEDAIWKGADPFQIGEEESPTNIVPHDIFRETPTGLKNIDVDYQGALVQLTGNLLTLPGPDGDGRKLTVSCDEYVIPIDISAAPECAKGLPVGATLRITGRCLLESTARTSYDIFPQLTRLTVIVRTPADIEVISRPPWWTPARLLGVIAALLAALLGFVVWNRILNRLVQRRGQELSRAEVAKASSELRVGERTRLAVELHDTLSQNLTGIALALNAGEYALAEKSLKSCREELKNCLWDLRNDALEEPDMNEAIRRTLTPHIGPARLTIRFSLRRNELTDNTAHAILRIVRELAVNAVRHGGASEIRVAGSVEEHRILFSVRNNGKGFDPLNVPGMDEGHFGLQGIRDRVKQMNGGMKVDSSPATGTKVSIWLKSKC